MKKIYVIVAALILSAVSMNAQSLSTILKAAATSAASQATGVSEKKAGSIIDAVTNVVYAYTGKTNAVSLPGTWSYLSSAVALDGEGTLATLAGTAASSTVEQKINETLQKFGFTQGAITFVFNEDLTFSCTFKGIPLSGRWKTMNDGATVQLQFGQTLKYLSMTGDLKSTASGCEMLFDANKFLSFAKSVLAVVGSKSSSLGAIATLSNNYKGMKLGFELAKK